MLRYLTQPLTLIGSAVIDTFEFIGANGLLLGSAAVATPRALLAKRGRRLAWQNLWEQMVRIGVKSIPIVALVVFCIGSILAMQMAPILVKYGVKVQVADIIAIALCRELGPLVGAIVLTGFAGASIAAEIGTMNVSEEIEALETSAISPIRFLVVPRVISTTIMMVCLSVVADVVGVIGGMLTSQFVLGIDWHQYLQHSFMSAKVRDFGTGLAKSAVFGMLISGLACYLGLNVSGGASGVGNATTRTVVLTIVTLIIVDLLFTTVFYSVGV